MFADTSLYIEFNLSNTEYILVFCFRTTAATHMHDHSSRSHAIVTVTFTQVLLLVQKYFETNFPVISALSYVYYI